MAGQWPFFSRVIILIFKNRVVAVRVLCCGLKPDWYEFNTEVVEGFFEDLSRIPVIGQVGKFGIGAVII